MPQLPAQFQDNQVLFAAALELLRDMARNSLAFRATAANQILVSTGPGNQGGDNTGLLQIPSTGQGVLRINADRSISLEQFALISGVQVSDTDLIPGSRLPVHTWALSNSPQIPASALPSLNVVPSQIGSTYRFVPSSNTETRVWKSTGITLPVDVNELVILRIFWDSAGSPTERFSPAVWLFSDDLVDATNAGVVEDQAVSGSQDRVYYPWNEGRAALEGTTNRFQGFGFCLNSSRELFYTFGNLGLSANSVLEISLYEARDSDDPNNYPEGTADEIAIGAEVEIRQWSPLVLNRGLARVTTDQTARDAAAVALAAAQSAQAEIDAAEILIAALQTGAINVANLLDHFGGYALVSRPTATIPPTRFGNDSIAEQKLSPAVRRKLNESGGPGGGLNSVSTDTTLEGDGTSDSVLRVANPLPALPSPGSRDNKVPKFDGDVLGWEVDETGTGGDGTTLPDIPEDGHEYTLRGRDNIGAGGSNDPIQYWERTNEVPNSPGTQSGIGRVLTVTGENDRDYAWRDAPENPDATARAAAAANAQDIAAIRQLPVLPAEGSRDNKIPKFAGDTLGWEEDAGGSAAAEQRVLVDVPASAATEDKLILEDGQAYTTIDQFVHEATPATATYENISFDLGYFSEESALDPNFYVVGRYYYNFAKHTPRVVAYVSGNSGPKHWVDANAADLVTNITGDVGHFGRDSEATPYIRAVGNVYYNEVIRSYRRATAYEAGAGPVTRPVRLRQANEQDLARIDGDTDGLADRTADLDVIVGRPDWVNAPSAEAQFTVYTDASSNGQLLRTTSRDSIGNWADRLTGTETWVTSALAIGVNWTIVRVKKGLNFIQYRQQNGAIGIPLTSGVAVGGDANWDYYIGISTGRGARDTIVMQKRGQHPHTAYHGELAGEALDQLNAVRDALNAEIEHSREIGLTVENLENTVQMLPEEENADDESDVLALVEKKTGRKIKVREAYASQTVLSVNVAATFAQLPEIPFEWIEYGTDTNLFYLIGAGINRLEFTTRAGIVIDRIFDDPQNRQLVNYGSSGEDDPFDNIGIFYVDDFFFLAVAKPSTNPLLVAPGTASNLNVRSATEAGNLVGELAGRNPSVYVTGRSMRINGGDADFWIFPPESTTHANLKRYADARIAGQSVPTIRLGFTFTGASDPVASNVRLADMVDGDEFAPRLERVSADHKIDRLIDQAPVPHLIPHLPAPMREGEVVYLQEDNSPYPDDQHTFRFGPRASAAGFDFPGVTGDPVTGAAIAGAFGGSPGSEQYAAFGDSVPSIFRADGIRAIYTRLDHPMRIYVRMARALVADADVSSLSLRIGIYSTTPRDPTLHYTWAYRTVPLMHVANELTAAYRTFYCEPVFAANGRSINWLSDFTPNPDDIPDTVGRRAFNIIDGDGDFLVFSGGSVSFVSGSRFRKGYYRGQADGSPERVFLPTISDPVQGGLGITSIQRLTQVQYDALRTKGDTTLYVIVG